MSSPTVICGSRRRSLENPGSRNPSSASISKFGVDTSKSTIEAGRNRACVAHAVQSASRNRVCRLFTVSSQPARPSRKTDTPARPKRPTGYQLSELNRPDTVTGGWVGMSAPSNCS